MSEAELEDLKAHLSKVADALSAEVQAFVSLSATITPSTDPRTVQACREMGNATHVTRDAWQELYSYVLQPYIDGTKG